MDFGRFQAAFSDGIKSSLKTVTHAVGSLKPHSALFQAAPPF